MSTTLFFRDDTYDGQLGRTLTAARAGMADIGEALATARAIGERANPTSWHDGWRARADRTAAIADASRQPATKRSALLRASEYYRQAYFFLRHDLGDTRLQDAYARHVAAFQAAVPLLDTPVERLTIEVGGAAFKGYLFTPDASGAARPTVLLPCGYDSTAEEGYAYVPALLARGFNAVSFEGPGQGAALNLHGITFRPDFAPVVTALIDQLVTRADVASEAIVLYGLSFAGYLAPQAAVHEHRLAALICNPAQPDMAAHLPSGIGATFAAPVVNGMMHTSATKAEFFGARMAAHGLDDISAYFADLRRFTMLDGAGEITCPTLIIECEGDFAGGGGATLQAAMSAPATLVNLGEADGAAGHCGGLGQTVWEEHVYDWLARVVTQPAMR